MARNIIDVVAVRAKLARFKKLCELSREKWRTAPDDRHVFVNEGMIQAYGHCLDLLAAVPMSEPKGDE